MRFCLLLLVFAGIQADLSAQTVNWATDIAPILYKHCVQCHRDGGIGAFPLTGYNSALANHDAIAAATGSRHMPPYKPDPKYRHFAEENVLTDAEIKAIKTWAAAGGPSGDLTKAPAVPKFTEGSQIGEPDHILQTPMHTMTQTRDEYRCFVVPNGQNVAKFLRGIEVIPSNHMAVHHVLVYEDTTGEARKLDARTPEAGYSAFGGIGVNGARQIGAWVPGNNVRLLPPFMGIKLTPKADVVVQVHYPAAARGMSSQTKINMFFTPTVQGIREVAIIPAINHFAPVLQNGPLAIPANTVKTFNAQVRSPAEGSIIGLAPHMHLIGRSVTSFAVTPRGDTIKMIRIPEWDFHWQGTYTFQKVQRLPAGSRIVATATYDNTLKNPFNPSNPPKNVALGEATTDEMFLIYFIFMAYQPGDENIVLDSSLLSQTLPVTDMSGGSVRSLRLSPNPVGEWLHIEAELADQSNVELTIFDATGRVVRSSAIRRDVAPGIYQEDVVTGDLPPGLYLARLQTAQGRVVVGRFVR